MEIFAHCRASAAILEESIKLLSKNGRFMAVIASISAILSSSVFLVFYFSNASLMSDMSLRQYAALNPSSTVYGGSTINTSTATAAAAAAGNPFEAIFKDARLLLLVDVSYLVAIFIVSFFSSVVTVIVSLASYNSSSGKNLSCKELISNVAAAGIRPAFITSFYTKLLSTGYLFVFSILVIPLLTFLITFKNIFSVTVVASVIGSIFYMYLDVEWILAFVVSLTEENNYGILGLGRAGVLITRTEGKKVQGFILNLFFYVLSSILSAGFVAVFGKKVIMGKNQTAFWIYTLVFSCLINMFRLVTYTVLYFHCKKQGGDEEALLELEAGTVGGYRKVSVEPPVRYSA